MWITVGSMAASSASARSMFRVWATWPSVCSRTNTSRNPPESGACLVSVSVRAVMSEPPRSGKPSQPARHPRRVSVEDHAGQALPTDHLGDGLQVFEGRHPVAGDQQDAVAELARQLAVGDAQHWRKVDDDVAVLAPQLVHEAVPVELVEDPGRVGADASS